MYLLKKINSNDDFEFTKILESGYDIYEQPNVISKVQFVNGKRKKIITDYEDVRIRIDLGGLDNTDLQDYLDNLEDGEYQYYSFEYNEYRNANFIITKPNLVVGKAFNTNNYYLEDFTVLLEKSSDVE